MNPLLADKLRRIEPYVPGEQATFPDLVKLNANENPYPPALCVQEVLGRFNTDALRFYPDANASNLRRALAAHFSVAENQIFMGNGSDDVLALCFQSFFCSNMPILFPDITYSFYPVWCRLFGTPYETIALNEAFRLDPRNFDKPNGGVILPNPNAPTGLAEPLSFIEDIISHNRDCVVLIDEAYVDFGAESAVSLLNRYENLIIVQTMSKSRSLAGLRVGYALASPALIGVLEAVKNSYNSYTMDAVTLAAAAASVKDDAYFRQTCTKIAETRERSASALAALGFIVCPSMANFLFVTHPRMSAQEIFKRLREKHIFIRWFNLPRIQNYLRITVGTDAEMNILLNALTEILT